MEKQLSGQQSARRKFFNWMMNWYSAKEDSLQVCDVLEVTDIVQLLTSTGFKLRHVDTIAALDQKPVAGETQDYSCRVVVSCAHSGLRAVLESGGTSCRCPLVDKSDGHFWEVRSSGPTSSKNHGSKTETGSSFFPEVHSTIAKVAHQVISSLLRLMAEPVENERRKSRSSYGSSYANLLVPDSSLAHCNLGGSAPQLYGSRDKLVTDTSMTESPIHFNRTSSHSAIEAAEIDQNLLLPKMKSLSFDRSSEMECEETVEIQASKSPLSAAPCKVPQDLKISFNKLTENVQHSLSLIESIKCALFSSQETTKKPNAVKKSGPAPKKSYIKTPKGSKFKLPSTSVNSSKAQATSATVTPKRQQVLNSTTRVPTPRPVLKKGTRTIVKSSPVPIATSTPDTKRNI
ncbi:uncharacterized protein [Anabrus simplex]|uniref:uncharacterized protein n=1 Tax=Anabrus simplex TaxID=316456 RepID=UPI0035A32FCC